jgi:hypothetical protein
VLKVQHCIVSPEAVLNVDQRHYPAIGAARGELLELGCNDNHHEAPVLSFICLP